MVMISVFRPRPQRISRLYAILLVAVLALPQLALAQRGGGARGAGFGFGGRGLYGNGHAGSYGRGSGIYGYPFLFGDYPETFIEPTPQFVVVDSKAPAAIEQHASAEPLLIELRGDQYVRVKESAAQEAANGTGTQVSNSAASAPQPAVIVYRDGHREQIPQYAITGGMIYLHGNYWENGYWTKTVPLSALDLNATIQANQQRGVTFILPTAPNVVIASF